MSAIKGDDKVKDKDKDKDKHKGLFLYQTQLGSIASVAVTHNVGCHATPFSGNLGLHVQDDEVSVLNRRARLEAVLGKRIQWLNQMHGTGVYTADALLIASPTADASTTVHPQIALAIMTADCLPIVFCAHNDKGEYAIGAAHAGWRGLLNGVIEATVAKLQAQVPNALIHAHLGPCIGVAQFEVGSKVRDAFIAKNTANARHFTARITDKYLCDLESLARDVLIGLGVQQVSGGGWCTVSDTRLASYRRNAVTGRFATLVWLN